MPDFANRLSANRPSTTQEKNLKKLKKFVGKWFPSVFFIVEEYFFPYLCYVMHQSLQKDTFWNKK